MTPPSLIQTPSTTNPPTTHLAWAGRGGEAGIGNTDKKYEWKRVTSLEAILPYRKTNPSVTIHKVDTKLVAVR